MTLKNWFYEKELEVDLNKISVRIGYSSTVFIVPIVGSVLKVWLENAILAETKKQTLKAQERAIS
jgi:hypothetical protein